MPLPDMDPGRRADLYGAVQFICDTFDIAYTYDNCDQLTVFLEALKIYDERTAQYGPIWKNAGALENFFDAYRKARRCKTVMLGRGLAQEKGMTAPDLPIDDALDTINYLIFGIRNAREGRIGEAEDDAGSTDHP